MDTPLAAYMERNSIKDDEFAVVIEKDRSLVNRLRRGHVRPTLEVAAKIEAATNGEVPMQAWIERVNLATHTQAATSSPEAA